MNSKAESSKVAERLAWLAGLTVKVRLGGEEFTAVYRDTIPLGRVYFLVLEEEGRKTRLVQTEHVVELTAERTIP